MHDLPNVRILQGDAGRWTPPQGLDGIVLDPPRTGATPELIAAINTARPARIVYVACDPVTFARDVRLLAPAYRVARLDAFDAFPMTHHVETVATLLPTGTSDKVS
jgi:tRNA/tmRNA/rRNA uracil-C5-methylase (TrmA/RlmC/RlmD family)